MEATANKGGEFISYPMNRVAGTIDDPTDAHAAIEALIEAGYKLEEIDVLYGEEGMRRLDPTGKEHWLLARFQRTVLQYNEERKYISLLVSIKRIGLPTATRSTSASVP